MKFWHIHSKGICDFVVMVYITALKSLYTKREPLND